MKGVSKYGQFIVRSSSNNSLEENSKSAVLDAKPGTLAERAKQGTKLLIKDGKLRAPLTTRSNNNNQSEKAFKLESDDKTVIGSSKITHQSSVAHQQQHNKPSESEQPKAVSHFKENLDVKDNFEVFQDDSEPHSSCLSDFSVNEEVLLSSTLTPNIDESVFQLPPVKFDEENDENSFGQAIRKVEHTSPFHVLQPAALNDSLSKKRRKCFEDVTEEFVNNSTTADDSLGDEEEEHASEYPSEYLTAKSSLSPFVKKERNVLYTTDNYDVDIYNYMHHRESQNIGRPRLNYIYKQNELNAEMRAVLIDWFVDVCQEYDLSPATFFLAVSLVDRTLSTVDCPRGKLQLLGATSIFVAAKMEEVYPPQLSEIVFITEDTYTSVQVRRMEKVILRVIDFDLNVPLVDTFANFFTLFKPISSKANCLMWYLLELSAMNYDCIRFKPSLLAASAYTLAKYVTAKAVKPIIMTERKEADDNGAQSCWPDELVTKTGIRRDELVEPANALAYLHRNAEEGNVKAMFSKYSIGSNYQVSCAIKMPDCLSKMFA